MAKVLYPAVAQILDVESWRGRLLLVVEFLPGGTLSGRLRGVLGADSRRLSAFVFSDAVPFEGPGAINAEAPQTSSAVLRRLGFEVTTALDTKPMKRTDALRRFTRGARPAAVNASRARCGDGGRSAWAAGQEWRRCRRRRRGRRGPRTEFGRIERVRQTAESSPELLHTMQDTHELLSPCPRFPWSCVCSRLDAPGLQQVEPLTAAGDLRGAFARLQRLVAELPRTVVVTATGTYLHAECRSRRGFVDDLECRLCASGRLIHVRSASRIGLLWDMGVNRARVEMLRRRLRETAGGPP